MYEYIPGFNDLCDVEYGDYRNEWEREFVTLLNQHVTDWTRFGLGDGDCFTFYDGVDLSFGINPVLNDF